MTKASKLPPSDPRQRLLELAKERGASLASLSEMLGRNPTYLQQFIKKGSPRKLEEGTAEHYRSSSEWRRPSWVGLEIWRRKNPT